MLISSEQFLAERVSRKQNLASAQRCACCNVALQETVTGCRPSEKGLVCSDCYFDAFGVELDNHPIFMPRSAHGA
jgi:hypothetical protein